MFGHCCSLRRPATSRHVGKRKNRIEYASGAFARLKFMILIVNPILPIITVTRIVRVIMVIIDGSGSSHKEAAETGMRH